MMTEARTLDRSGCKVHYRDEGPEGAPVVVLTHGASRDHHMFEPQLASPTAKFRTIRRDLPGHGRLKPVPAEFSLSGVLEDLVAILALEKVDQVTLIGRSMGGDPCQEFLYRHHRRVARIFRSVH